MKVKLVKQGDRWVLYNEDGSKMALSTESPYNKLSIKNCEEIQRGYDLDELALTHADLKLIDDDERYYQGHKCDKHDSFIEGFQKALEILGDKKFSEDDLRLAMHFGKFGEANSQTTTIGFIKSLQQTEWDVEICCYIGNGDKESDSFKDPLVTNTGIPKLDDGCLILRRI
jgi:hypothetical protein